MAKRTTSPKSAKRAKEQTPKKSAARKGKQQPAAPSMYKVFISHSSKESWIARQISKEINDIGLKTWVDDTDLHGGDEIESTIKNGIHDTQEVLVIVSTNSVMSQWVFYEVAIAKVEKKRVTPILNNVGSDVIGPLKSIKNYDLNDFDKFLLELAKRAGQNKEIKK
jgi:hypothetical protein